MEGDIIFEYDIVRLGKRIDVILLIRHMVFSLEFKNGKNVFTAQDARQAEDYAIDIKNFHKESEDLYVCPILIATDAPEYQKEQSLESYPDKQVHLQRENIETVIPKIRNYIMFRRDLKECRVEEFYDDGFSGANFARPGFEKLMAKIRKEEINLVIVKDFSRFGRDYIELGDYLERIFPYLGVRFISINDGYDSVEYGGTTAGLDVALKNVVYDYYSRELSEKVKSAKLAKMKRGEYSGGRVPFGMMKDPDRKGHLLVDPDAGRVVRESFDLAIAGDSVADIARKLNSDGEMTPAVYFRSKDPKEHMYEKTTRHISWTHTNVRRILQSETYYGANVAHKREITKRGTTKSAGIEKEDQIIVEDVHEAIVTKTEFSEAQKAIKEIRNKKRPPNTSALFQGILRCASCKRVLQCYPRVKRVYYKCSNSLVELEGDCNDGKVYEDILKKQVLIAYRNLFDLADLMEQVLEEQKAQRRFTEKNLAAKADELRKKLEQLESRKLLNVEKWMSGIMGKDIYLKKREQLDIEIADTQSELQKLESRLQQDETAADRVINGTVKSIQHFAKESIVSREMLVTFFEAIYVTDPEHIELQWKFSDEFKEFLLEVERRADSAQEHTTQEKNA